MLSAQTITELVAAFLGTLGFSLFYRVTVSGGVLTWAAYLIIHHFYNDAFASNMLAAMFAALWAEIFARIKKAPTNVFLIPAILPLLPGQSFYYTMAALVHNHRAYFAIKAMETLRVVFSIACGVLTVSMFFYLLREIHCRIARIPIPIENCRAERIFVSIPTAALLFRQSGQQCGNFLVHG